MAEFKLTEKGKLFIKYLQDAGIASADEAQSAKEIAEGMGLEKANAVAGSLRNPIKNDLVDKTEDKPAKYFLTAEGQEVDANPAEDAE